MEPARTKLPDSALDYVLTRQLAVAWAGEGGDPPRLTWWKTFMVHEDGGLALFEGLAPTTFSWAVFQGAREAARRADATLRSRAADPDKLYTLFRFGYEIDERLDERLMDLKRAGAAPAVALPDLGALCGAPWSRGHFDEWCSGHGKANHEVAPAGRRLTGARPSDIESQARNLVAALADLPAGYPLPHYKVG